jgi:hypothetical protein
MKNTVALIMTLIPLALGGCQKSAPVVEEAQAATATAAAKSSATAENPIVVELYQSQGCSSCPPANAAVNAVADQPGVIALSFAVTYWDRLGWKDIFGDKAYTQRQYDYAHALGNANVATPQIIINGKTAITGIKRGELANTIAVSKPVANGPKISLDKDIVTVGKGAGKANVWLVGYDPRVQSVAIRSGENTGRTLPHRNIVRSLTKLGEWNGGAGSFRIPANPDDRLKIVILLQRPHAGEIIAAKKI